MDRADVLARVREALGRALGNWTITACDESAATLAKTWHGNLADAIREPIPLGEDVWDSILRAASTKLRKELQREDLKLIFDKFMVATDSSASMRNDAPLLDYGFHYIARIPECSPFFV